MDLDLERDPPPDLAIEIEISRSAIDKLAIYGDLGVREVWFYDGDAIRIEVMQAGWDVCTADCEFRTAGTHRGDCRGFLARRNESDETTWVRSIHEWARNWGNRSRFANRAAHAARSLKRSISNRTSSVTNSPGDCGRRKGSLANIRRTRSAARRHVRRCAAQRQRGGLLVPRYQLFERFAVQAEPGRQAIDRARRPDCRCRCGCPDGRGRSLAPAPGNGRCRQSCADPRCSSRCRANPKSKTRRMALR